ncbi:MAG: polyprenyl synthetase family protein [Planctomycetia bacterium]|nr:polyprenyl synthetase family protein [Planctomycetia bacterium]
MESPEKTFSKVPDELSSAYRLIDSELEQVQALLHDLLKQTSKETEEIVRYSFKLGGKRLRPVLVLLSGKVAGAIRQEHLYAASALELIHTGTLVHDDILDGAQFRRHLETIHVRWDSKAAVLAGDYLLILAILMITRCRDLNAYQIVAEACRATCDGELRQNRNCSHFEMSLEEYQKIIGGKTASLLECSCELGAYFSGADQDRINCFKNFGYDLGISFQIVDDILDLVGDEENTGKTLGTDLINHKPTLPLILYLESASKSDRTEMLDLLNRNEMDQKICDTIRQQLIGSGSVRKAKEYAKSILENACQKISNNTQADRNADQAAAMEALFDVARFVVARKL